VPRAPSSTEPRHARVSASAAKPRVTRAQQGAATRAALLRAASSAICELGMQGASIDLIAARAGYTKGAFYAHFDSKEQMFLAVLKEKFAAELTRLEAALTGAGDPAAEARAAAEGFLAFVDSDPEWPRLYQEFVAHAARSAARGDAFRAQLAVHHRELRARIADVFARWTAARGIEPVVPHADAAAMVFFMADGFLLTRIIDPALDDALYATMSSVFLRGLLALGEDRDAAAARAGG
jgi:AcrR family transcriptional regulator